MSISKSLLPEFDNEMKNTRKTLERVPYEKFDWGPHEKSMLMGALATHISNIPTWANHTVGKEALDLAPEGKPLPGPALPASTAELVAAFDKNVAEAREAIAAADDDELF